MNKVHYEVNGIQNNQVKTQLKNALNKIDGIRNVNINMEQSSIEVGFNNNTDEFAIRDCIETVGCHIV